MSEDAQVATTDATGQEPAITTPNAGSVEATTVTPGGVESLPDWAQSEIKSLRQESAKRRKAVRDAEKAAQVAADATLVEQKKWQELADQRQVRIDELEPLESSVQNYRDAITKLLDDRVTELGDRAKTAIDGLPEGMDALAKLTWLNDNTALFAQRAGTPQIDATRRNEGTTSADITDAEVIEFAARLGVNPAYVNKAQVLKARLARQAAG